MSRFIFASDLWQRPAGYEPPAIHHDDPVVMALAKVIMDANPNVTEGWDYQMDGATQDSAYYADPYRRTIETHIAMAVAVRDELVRLGHLEATP